MKRFTKTVVYYVKEVLKTEKDLEKRHINIFRDKMNREILTSMTAEELQSIIEITVARTIEDKLSHFNTAQTQEDDILLTKKEVSELLKVSHGTVHLWKESGFLPYYKISNRIYYKKNEVISSLKKFQLRRIG